MTVCQSTLPPGNPAPQPSPPGRRGSFYVKAELGILTYAPTTGLAGFRVPRRHLALFASGEDLDKLDRKPPQFSASRLSCCDPRRAKYALIIPPASTPSAISTTLVQTTLPPEHPPPPRPLCPLLNASRGLRCFPLRGRLGRFSRL